MSIDERIQARRVSAMEEEELLTENALRQLAESLRRESQKRSEFNIKRYAERPADGVETHRDRVVEHENDGAEVERSNHRDRGADKSADQQQPQNHSTADRQQPQGNGQTDKKQQQGSFEAIQLDDESSKRRSGNDSREPVRSVVPAFSRWPPSLDFFVANGLGGGAINDDKNNELNKRDREKKAPI